MSGPLQPLITAVGCHTQQLKHYAPHHAGSAVSKASGASSSGHVVFLPLDQTHSVEQEEGSELLCDENEVGTGPTSCHAAAPAEWRPPPSYGSGLSSHSDLLEMLSRLMRGEREHPLSPADYIAAAAPPPPGGAVTPQMRSVVASWLSEVAGEFKLQQETLFLGVRLLDSFQAASPAGVPRNVLQLVAVACMMVASKQDEVSHPSVDDFTEIAADAFKREDLLRMERLLLDALEWRVQQPTAYTFLHILTQARAVLSGRLTRRGVALSAYLAELSLLDYALLPRPPSLVAAAALAAGAAWHGGGGGGGGCGGVLRELEAATGYSASELGGCAAQLLHLLQCAAAGGRDAWLCISHDDASGAAAAAAALSLGLQAAAGGQPPAPPPAAAPRAPPAGGPTYARVPAFA
ncbi:MAG: cyclin-like protein [Monoraphidium minutum]|nr:MAG: cyclin-like protein [Monoraphidium minutum]